MSFDVPPTPAGHVLRSAMDPRLRPIRSGVGRRGRRGAARVPPRQLARPDRAPATHAVRVVHRAAGPALGDGGRRRECDSRGARGPAIALGHRRGFACLGCAMGWIAVQMALLREVHWLHVIYGALGLATASLGGAGGLAERATAAALADRGDPRRDPRLRGAGDRRRRRDCRGARRADARARGDRRRRGRGPRARARAGDRVAAAGAPRSLCGLDRPRRDSVVGMFDGADPGVLSRGCTVADGDRADRRRRRAGPVRDRRRAMARASAPGDPRDDGSGHRIGDAELV